LGVGVGQAVLGFPVNIGDHVREVPAKKQGLPERRLVWLGVSDENPEIPAGVCRAAERADVESDRNQMVINP
jgi:hypothetical protein